MLLRRAGVRPRCPAPSSPLAGVKHAPCRSAWSARTGALAPPLSKGSSIRYCMRNTRSTAAVREPSTGSAAPGSRAWLRHACRTTCAPCATSPPARTALHSPASFANERALARRSAGVVTRRNDSGRRPPASSPALCTGKRSLIVGINENIGGREISISRALAFAQSIRFLTSPVELSRVTENYPVVRRIPACDSPASSSKRCSLRRLLRCLRVPGARR